jgi:hypothetical protein
MCGVSRSLSWASALSQQDRCVARCNLALHQRFSAEGPCADGSPEVVDRDHLNILAPVFDDGRRILRPMRPNPLMAYSPIRFRRPPPYLPRRKNNAGRMECEKCGLGVEPQEVVLAQAEATDGCFIIDAGMRPMPVVAVEPVRQLGLSIA